MPSILTLNKKILMIFFFHLVHLYQFHSGIFLILVGINGRVPDFDYFIMFNKLLLSLSADFHYKRSAKYENKLQNTMQYTGKSNICFLNI